MRIRDSQFVSRAWRGAALAGATVLLAWAGTVLLRGVVPDRPLSLVFFFAAVAISAGLGGLWSGVLATLLSALACDYFFLTPVHSFALAASDAPLFILFVLAAVIINGLSERLRAETRKSDARYQDEFKVLNTVSTALSAALELCDFRRLLQSQLAEHLGIEGGCLYLAENDERTLRLVDTWGLSAGAAEDLIGPDPMALIVGGATSGPEARPAARSPYRAAPVRLSRDQRRRGLSDGIAVPLPANEDLRGVLCIFGAAALREAGRDAAFFTTLGRQVGTLLQNVILYEQILLARERLQQVSRQLVSVQEAERRAIARELHDEIGQVLTGLKLNLERCAIEPEEVSAAPVATALSLVHGLIHQVDGMSLDLRPPALDDLGLLPALAWHCRRFTGLTGIDVELVHTGVEPRLPAEIEITAYRIVQEGLTNVARHARVKCATVRLWRAGDSIGVQVADKGEGFDLDIAEKSGAAGLDGMRERAALLGGSLLVETAPGAGTLITAELPAV